MTFSWIYQEIGVTRNHDLAVTLVGDQTVKTGRGCQIASYEILIKTFQ